MSSKGNLRRGLDTEESAQMHVAFVQWSDIRDTEDLLARPWSERACDQSLESDRA